jgi:hypothetical protein
MGQLHKRFTDAQVKDMLGRYLRKEIAGTAIRAVLGIGKTRFFQLLHRYQADPQGFSIGYARRQPPRRLDPAIEQNLLKELAIDQQAIQNPAIPLKSYNYSYVRTRLKVRYRQTVSLSTLIARAKSHGFYLPRRPRKIHDREVLTRYVGELIQHDSSHHLWAPAAGVKWYLITSLDDFSRYLLYAALLTHETLWAHLLALQTVVLTWGFPYAYYVDCHSFFRYVRGRDVLPREFPLAATEYQTQWKQVLTECGVKPLYALSPQAKGKIERPYGWLQDHLIRTCVRESITTVEAANRVLAREVHHYNHVQVHSTTGEVPARRLRQALRQRQSLWREFRLPPPLRSVKDLFALRLQRMVDAYRRISVNRLPLQVHGASPGQLLTLRVYPLSTDLAEVRFWHEGTLLDVQRIKHEELKLVHV